MPVTYVIRFDVRADSVDRFLSLLDDVLDAMREEPNFHEAMLHRDPDTAHRFLVKEAEATHVRLDIFPDGGVARLRLFGSLTPDGIAHLQRRWRETS